MFGNNNGFSLIDMYSSEGSSSVFDSRNDTKGSNNLFGGESIYAEMNKRETNHGSLSMVDRLRGVQAGRFDLGDGVSLAEQYNDKSLDKRTFGGAYNVTISDIYKDDSLFREHHNLYTDGYIKEQESTQLDLQRDDFLNQKSDMLTVSDMTKSRDDLYQRNNEAGEDFNQGQSTFIQNSSEKKTYVDSSPSEYAGSLGIYSTKYAPNKGESEYAKHDISKKNLSSEYLKTEETKSNEKDKDTKNIKNVKVRKNNKEDEDIHYNFLSQQQQTDKDKKEEEGDYIEFKAYDRVRIDSEAVLKAKELNMDKDNPEKITSKMLRDEFYKPYVEQEYSELKKTIDTLEEKFQNSESEIERNTIEKEMSIIKPILIKKALYGDI